MPEFLEFRNVSKRFDKVQAVDAVSLEIKRGEFFSLLGPSGCGKTTMLRILAGFERPDQGSVFLDGQDITALPPNRRPVNTVFQSYALFPHLSVAENIAFGLRIARRPASEIRDQVARMLTLIRMEEHGHRKPHQISGGQRQRVAVARALVNRPRVLLLDEPLAALDLKLRQSMLLELDLIHDEVGITFLYVTHDQTEAMSVSDRIAVMNRGRLEQTGTPPEVYESPKSRFVAAFIGDANFFDGRVAGAGPGPSDEYVRVEIGGLPPLLCFNDRRKAHGDLVHLIIRPEKIRLQRDPPAPDVMHNAVEGTVDDVVYGGNHTRYWVRTGPHRLGVYEQHGRFLLDQKRAAWNDRVWLTWHADDGYMLDRDDDDAPALAAPAPAAWSPG